MSQRTQTGYFGVSLNAERRKNGAMYVAQLGRDGTTKFIGTYDTRVKVAVAVAKYIASIGGAVPEADQVVDGWVLPRSRTSETGYLGVSSNGGLFQARKRLSTSVSRARGGRTHIHIGSFDTPLEAAIVRAQYLAAQEAGEEPVQEDEVVDSHWLHLTRTPNM